MLKVQRATTGTLIVALMLSIGMQCFVGEELSATQMACCTATDHDCGAGVSEDCCRSESGDQDQLVPQAQQVVFPMALISSTIPSLVPQVDTNTASAFDVDASRLKAESPPKYVLLGSFLI